MAPENDENDGRAACGAGPRRARRTVVAECNDAIATGGRRGPGLEKAMEFARKGLLSQQSCLRLSTSVENLEGLDRNRGDGDGNGSAAAASTSAPRSRRGSVVTRCNDAIAAGGNPRASLTKTNSGVKQALKFAERGLLSQQSMSRVSQSLEHLRNACADDEEVDDEGPRARVSRPTALRCAVRTVTGGVEESEEEEEEGDDSSIEWSSSIDSVGSATRATWRGDSGELEEPPPGDGREEAPRRQGKDRTLPLVAKVSLGEKASPVFDAMAPGREAATDADVLTEGQHYLSISMLVYMYSTLRETCRMGHTHVTLEEVDVNSSGYPPRHPDDEAGGEGTKYLEHTKSPGGIVRIVIDMLDEWQQDAKGGGTFGPIGSKAAHEYENSMMREFIRWIEDSKRSQLDASTEAIINSLRRQAAKRRWGAIKSAVTLVGSFRQSSDSIRSDGRMAQPQDDKTTAQVIHLRRQVARYRWKRAITRVIIALRLSGPVTPGWDFPTTNNNVRALKKNTFVDMTSVLNAARNKKQKFFREGSVMDNLIESGIEVVWFSDLTQNDVVYGICCQRAEKRVIVVFRGTVSSHNWLINLKYGTSPIPNPISEEYPDRTDMVDLHTGFSLYMLRQRRDTQMNKIEEIFEKVDKIGREMAPGGDYKLSITGHSMGGALANLLGFYAAASKQFANVRQVKVYTFASPLVGTTSFLQAYQHLERCGKLRHARFSCSGDMVPTVPFCNFDGFKFWNWKCYRHAGMKIRLGAGPLTKWKLRRALDVTYPLKSDWFTQIRRMCLDNILVNLTTVSGMKRNHTLTEYQKRLNLASQYRLALGKSVLFHDPKRNRLKSLEEYYQIRAKMTTDNNATPVPQKSKYKNAWISAVVLCLSILWWTLLMAVTNSFSNDNNMRHTFIIRNRLNNDEHESPIKKVGNANQIALQLTLLTDNENIQPVLDSSSLPLNTEIVQNPPSRDITPDTPVVDSLSRGDDTVSDRETQGTVADYSGTSSDRAGGQEEQKPPLTSPVNFPLLNDTQSVLNEALHKKYLSDRSIHPIAKDRARESCFQQWRIIVNTLQEIQKTGSIQATAFDRAKEKLLAFASHHVN